MLKPHSAVCVNGCCGKHRCYLLNMAQSECFHFLILLYQSCRKQKCFSLLKGQYSFCFTRLSVFFFLTKEYCFNASVIYRSLVRGLFGHSNSVILITLSCWISITVNVVWLFVTAVISLQVTADRRYPVTGFVFGFIWGSLSLLQLHQKLQLCRLALLSLNKCCFFGHATLLGCKD